MKLNKIPLPALKGVGAKVAERLSKIGLNSVEDMLFHLPLHYQDRTRLYPIKDIKDGMQVSVQGEVVSCQVQFGKRRILKCKISDGEGIATLNFFHFNAGQKNAFKEGQWIQCFGEFKRGYQGLEVTHPEYSLVGENAATSVEEALTPIYPSTEGLKQNSLRQLTDQALQHLQQNQVEELIPTALLTHPISLYDALMTIHRPPPSASIEQLEDRSHPAQQRLIIEELLAQQISMLALRQQAQQHHSPVLKQTDQLSKQLLKNLPFSPTGAQQRVNLEMNKI